jgi:hypothetical protein
VSVTMNYFVIFILNVFLFFQLGYSAEFFIEPKENDFKSSNFFLVNIEENYLDNIQGLLLQLDETKSLFDINEYLLFSKEHITKRHDAYIYAVKENLKLLKVPNVAMIKEGHTKICEYIDLYIKITQKYRDLIVNSRSNLPILNALMEPVTRDISLLPNLPEVKIKDQIFIDVILRRLKKEIKWQPKIVLDHNFIYVNSFFKNTENNYARNLKQVLDIWLSGNQVLMELTFNSSNGPKNIAFYKKVKHIVEHNFNNIKTPINPTLTKTHNTIKGYLAFYINTYDRLHTLLKNNYNKNKHSEEFQSISNTFLETDESFKVNLNNLKLSAIWEEKLNKALNEINNFQAKWGTLK